MDPNRRRIDIIADPEFVGGIAAIAIDELRNRRAMCDEVDNELSYYRRLLHGRMDLLSFELRRRSGEETRTLIEALPEILAGDEVLTTAPTTGRAVPVEIPDLPDTGRRTVDRALSDDFLSRLPDLEQDDLEEIQSVLTEVESEISEQRRLVYDSYEKLQAELTRRYRDGIANIDELLGSD